MCTGIAHFRPYWTLIMTFIITSFGAQVAHAKTSWYRRNVARPVEKFSGAMGNVLKNTVMVPVKLVQTVGNVVEAGANVLEGDNKSAKKAWQRAGNNLNDAKKHFAQRNDEYYKVAQELLIKLPAHAAVEIWQEMQSISFEILSGEDPEKVKRQVEKMVLDCQSRSTELKNLVSSPDFVNKFNAAKGKLESGTAVAATVTHALLASYGIELATIAGMDATGGVITATVGCFIILASVKHEALKQQYEKAVETCAQIYQQDAQYLEDIATAHRRKRDTNRNFILGKINNFNQQILQLNKEFAAEITVILANHLSRTISPSELGGLLAEYEDLLEDQIHIFGQKVEAISAQIANYNDILNDEQALVDYVQE